MNTPEIRKPVAMCKNLRCKEMYYQAFDSSDGATPMAFWCTKTMETFGPDGSAVDNQECIPGRKCFGK
jgi:hypothetical protein